jgi:DNA-binding FadR family transcriptional regulator
MPTPESTGSSGPDTPENPAPQRRKIPDRIAERVREQILGAGLRPGDRVPAQWLLPVTHKASRGSMREAQKILEFQGLIRSKTGPGGGVFVDAITPEHAIRMLDNLFLFEPPSLSDIYALRRWIEPELAASAAGRLDPGAFARLQATVHLYEDPPRSGEEEYRQRLAELDFHAELARLCPNRVLGFIATFLLSLLRDMTVCRDIYRLSNPELRERGLHYQVRLLRAMKAGDVEGARRLMFEHMVEAEHYMVDRAEVVARPRREVSPGGDASSDGGGLTG